MPKTRTSKRVEPAARVPLGLRVTPAIKKQLDDAALASGRSQSQEAEIRLEHTFTAANAVLDALDLAYGRRLTGLLLAIAHSAQITGTRAISMSQWNFEGGEDWMSDPYAYDQAVAAITTILEAQRPPGDVVIPRAQLGLPQDTMAHVGAGFARDLLAAVEKKSASSTVRADLVKAIRDRTRP